MLFYLVVAAETFGEYIFFGNGYFDNNFFPKQL